MGKSVLAGARLDPTGHYRPRAIHNLDMNVGLIASRASPPASDAAAATAPVWIYAASIPFEAETGGIFAPTKNPRITSARDDILFITNFNALV